MDPSVGTVTQGRTLMSDHPTTTAAAKFAGLKVDLPGLGHLGLTHLYTKTTETSIYRTENPGIVVKMFDLDCGGRPDEMSYGPYTRFQLELANFEDIMNLESLRRFVPIYYGANINYENKYAYIAMEFFHGEDLQSWCDNAANEFFPDEWVTKFKEAIFEAFSILTLFHKHGIVVVDFKPDNIIRLGERGVKFVDMGAFFTSRHHNAPEKYVYSATPDYAELLIDVSNIDTGIAPSGAADIFSAGVALFEMATGNSRLELAEPTADEILARPELYRFRDSQIRDLWKQYPHLQELLPLVETQLKARRILFSEVWHLLKGYVGGQVPDWETLPPSQRDNILLATGTTFIAEQLPEQLHWLGGAIAQSTVLRSMRLKSVNELLGLIQSPAPEPALQDVDRFNTLVQYMRDLERPTEFIQRLNTWDTRLNRETGHWAVSAPLAYAQLSDDALFTFVKEAHRDPLGHRFFEIVADLEADDYQDCKLTLWHLQDDHLAWLGGAGEALPAPASQAQF
jgi:serine/threonine protein kinase